MKLCECGCGEIVKPGNRFILGHNTRIRSKEVIRSSADKRRGGPRRLPREFRICICGCGKEFECKVNSLRRYIYTHNPKMDGKHHTEETKKKMSNSHKKGKDSFRWVSRETRTCACGCGETFECRPSSQKRFVSQYHFYKYNRGESNTLYGRRGKDSPNYGRKLSEEHKEAISKSKKENQFGESNPFYGKKHSKETKKKMSKARVNYMKNNEGCWKNTSIELKIHNLLSDLGIEFETHKSFNQIGINSDKYPYHQVDIYCSDYKLIIECDGEYWHGKNFPENIKSDAEQIKEIINSGFSIIRLRETDINNDLVDCRRRILDYV